MEKTLNFGGGGIGSYQIDMSKMSISPLNHRSVSVCY